jgi:hypothetical protein
MNWIKQFDFKQQRVWQLPDKTPLDKQTLELLKSFISTEIIEKLIEDIPSTQTIENGPLTLEEYKELIKSKWL